MKKSMILLAALFCCTMSGYAQDGNIQQIQAGARTVSRTPEGDRSHYGLWAKDMMKNWDKVKAKPRFSSPADSLQKYREFTTYYSQAYYAYRTHNADSTILYGDSALMTGFDTPELLFYMADSYEQLGDYDHALIAYQQAKAKGHPAGGKALSEFKKRQKARRKAAKK
ncbi:MAG: tetratricopeptide repeat protein [Prevotella sp.]|nr:tetratricopeptide repeat protein [Prevotella sp.]